MRLEKQKRSEAGELLKSFSEFRTRYLDIHKENDFPHNRLLFCAPELAFPVLGSLAQQWNNSEHKKSLGRVSLYPVGRFSPPVHDSILNFLEMWETKEPALYIEINEDFNLNLKVPERLEKEKWTAAKSTNDWEELIGLLSLNGIVATISREPLFCTKWTSVS